MAEHCHVATAGALTSLDPADNSLNDPAAALHHGGRHPVARVAAARRARGRQPARLGRLAALGFVSLTVYFTFENLGIAHTSASDAAILIATIPIFVLVVNAFTTRERTTGSQWLGVVLSFAGVAALAELGARGAGGSTLGGNLLVLAACVAGALYTVMARRLMVTRSAVS